MKSGSKAIKAGLGYTVANIALKGLSFVSIPIFTRLLSTEDYGFFNSYTAFESILFILIGLCLHTSLKNAKYDYNQTEYTDYVSDNVLLSVLSCIVFLILGNIFFDVYKNFFNDNRIILNLLIFHSYGTALLTFYNQKIALEYEYKKYVKISLFNALLNIVLSIILIVYVFDNKFLARVVGAATPMIIISIYILIYFFKIKKPKINIKYWKYSLKISLPLIPHGISQVILSQFDRIMIQNMISASSAGIYSFSYNIGIILQTLTTSADTAWSPYFFEKINNNEIEDVRKKYNLYMGTFTVITIILLLISPEIIMILGPKEYWDAKFCALPIILSIYFSFLYTIIANVEYYYKKNKYIAIGTMGAAIINIILNTIFISKYGYIAAPYTTLVSYMIYFIFHYFIYSRITKKKIFYLKDFVLNIILAILFYIIAVIFINKILFRIIISAIVFILYYFIIKKVGVMNLFHIIKRRKCKYKK